MCPPHHQNNFTLLKNSVKHNLLAFIRHYSIKIYNYAIFLGGGLFLNACQLKEKAELAT